MVCISVSLSDTPRLNLHFRALTALHHRLIKPAWTELSAMTLHSRPFSFCNRTLTQPQPAASCDQRIRTSPALHAQHNQSLEALHYQDSSKLS